MPGPWPCATVQTARLTMTPDDRRQREAAGRRAESLAAFWLRLKGYRIIARRHRTPVGEIDILAGKGNILVAVEVKNRPSLETGLSAVTPKQWSRIARAMQWTFSARPDLAEMDGRFDLIVVCGLRPHHITDAWQP